MKKNLKIGLIILIISIVISTLTFYISKLLDFTYKYDQYENKNPKVTVVIPVYNAEKTIKNSLECLINQTLKDFEIICINDGSTDKSLKILKEYAKKHSNIRIYSQRNKGAGAARNRGLDLARGKYIIFLDADDLYKYNTLEKLYLKATATNSDIVVCGNSEARSDDNITFKIENYLSTNSNLISKDVFNYKNTKENIFYFTYFQAWNKFYLREFLTKNNLRFQEVRYFEDLDFVFTSLAIAERVATVNDYLITYINVKTSKTLSKYGKKNKDYFYKAFSKFQESIREKIDWTADFERIYINTVVRVFFVEYDNAKKQYHKKDQKKIIKNNLDGMVKILIPLGIANKKPNYFYSRYDYIRLRPMLILYGIEI